MPQEHNSPKREHTQRHRLSDGHHHTIPIDALIAKNNHNTVGSIHGLGIHSSKYIPALSRVALANLLLVIQNKKIFSSTFNNLALFEIALILSSSSVFLYAFSEPALFGINYFFLLFICISIGLGIYSNTTKHVSVMMFSVTMEGLFLTLMWWDHWIQQLDLFDFIRDYFWIHTIFLYLIIRKQAYYIYKVHYEEKRRNRIPDPANITPVHVYIHGQNASRRRALSEEKPILM
ncbi:4 TM domain-containing transmembrane protein [Acrasis kona]|uniref:4 TM domain-containing transmembrane protein n=1 Tax=Acrasis kona TaxID=1008807 RepID=A0AAW2Z7G6_9EUKA